MLVARGLGHPGGLLVAYGLGTAEQTVTLDAFQVELTDPGPALAIDQAELHVEDLRALLVYDRSPELVQDVTLTVVDVAPVFETTTHITTIDPEEHE
jgi:hypothetical protein